MPIARCLSITLRDSLRRLAVLMNTAHDFIRYILPQRIGTDSKHHIYMLMARCG